jgi:hypothetical protein
MLSTPSSNETGKGGESPYHEGGVKDLSKNSPVLLGDEANAGSACEKEVSSYNSSDDEELHDSAPTSSSTSTNHEYFGTGSAMYLSHEAAVNREKDRVMQRRLYSEGKGFPFSVDLANSVKRVLKEKIFPKIKLLSDTEPQYMAPDFVGASMDQARNICDVLMRELEMPDNLENKIGFWITYRSLVKNQIVKYRSNCVEELKKQYFKGRHNIVGI